MSPTDRQSPHPDSGREVKERVLYSLPLHVRIGVMLAAMWVIFVVATYAGLLVVVGLAMVLACNTAFEHLALGQGNVFINAGVSAALACAGVLWAWMFRPLWVKPARRTASQPLKKVDQPILFSLFAVVAERLGMEMPTSVRMAWSDGVVIERSPGTMGWLANRKELVIGAAVLGTCNVRHAVGAVMNALGQVPNGLTGRWAWTIRGLVSWLDRAAKSVFENDENEEMMMAAIAKKKRKKAGLFLRAWRGFVWISQRPIWFMDRLARVAATPALRSLSARADAAEARMLGGSAFFESLTERLSIQTAVKRTGQLIHQGISSGRLPDNLLQAAVKSMPTATERTLGMADRESPWHQITERRVSKVQHLEKGTKWNEDGPIAALIERFADLSRHITQMHYQQDLGLSLVQFKLVAAGEATGSGSLEEKASLEQVSVIKRYFCGLVDPDRALCGLVKQSSYQPTLVDLRQQVLSVRQFTQSRSHQINVVLQEWRKAWQRWRDLEMANLYSRVGIRLDSHQYGVLAHQPKLYEEEITRQRMVMEYSDDALKCFDEPSERRFAAALGLIMMTPDLQLPEELAALRAQLPIWGHAYGEMAHRLPILWELLALAHARDSMGSAGGDDSSEDWQATCRELNVRFHKLGLELISGLEHVPDPAENSELSLQQRLLQQETSPAKTVLAPEEARMTEVIRVTLNFQKVYHEVFSSLAGAAELAETHLVDGVAAEVAPQSVEVSA